MHGCHARTVPDRGDATGSAATESGRPVDGSERPSTGAGRPCQFAAALTLPTASVNTWSSVAESGFPAPNVMYVAEMRTSPT